MPTHKNDIAELIRELRTFMKISQQRFAGKVGVAIPTISRWENGHTVPCQMAIRRLYELSCSLGPAGKGFVDRFLAYDPDLFI